MFSETGLDSQISDKLRKDIEAMGLEELGYKDLKRMKQEKKENTANNFKKMQDQNLRYWIRNKDKEMYLDFNEEYRKKIRDYFNSLDVHNTGSIGIEQLEEPMITLGIAKGRNDVKKIMDEIDEDGSGEIELAEFLQILKGKGTIYGDQSQSANNSAITEFFKSKSLNFTTKSIGMIDGKIEGVEREKNESASFSLTLGRMRRQKLLEQIEKKNYNNELLVPYRKLNEQIKPENRVNTSLESRFFNNYSS